MNKSIQQYKQTRIQKHKNMSDADIKLASRELHTMSIEEQKDLYGNEGTLNVYFVKLADRVRQSVSNGYLLPYEMRADKQK